MIAESLIMKHGNSMYLLDTNIIIGFLKNDPMIVDHCNKINEINLSVISVGEMLYGVEKSTRKNDNHTFYLSFFNSCAVYPVDNPTAREYASLRYRLKASGKPIPENDLWIAATANALNFTLITRDQHLLGIKKFADVIRW